MPIIVPVENDVDIAGATDKKFRAADYSGSGLEALGAGLSTLGSGGQELADALDEKRRHDLMVAAQDEKQRQDQALATALARVKLGTEHQSNIDDATVKQAYGGYADQSADLLYGPDGLFTQRGLDAHAAFPGTVSGLTNSYDKALALLDPVQRGFLTPILTDRMNSDVDRGTLHVQQEGVAAQRGAAANLVNTATRDARLHADDPDLYDHHLQTGVNAIRQQGRLENVPDAVLGKQIDDYTSGVHAGMIGDLIPHDPVQAAGQYAQLGNEINPSDKLLVEAKLGPALANTQAIADVDGASNPDPTAAPVNPHAGDDATTLLKMQGITPMMDKTELPALMKRYGNDPAKAWAAFEAGPSYLDRLIAQRGDDWYAGLDDDTRRFVNGNMHMLGAATSARSVPANPQATAAQINASPFELERRTAALRELDARGSPREPVATAVQQTPRMLPVGFSPDSQLQSGNSPQTTAASTPPGTAIPAGDQSQQPAPAPKVPGQSATPGPAALAGSPSAASGTALAAAPTPIVPLHTATVGKERILAAAIPAAKVGRLSGENALATPAMEAAAQAQINKVRVAHGNKEILAFAYLMPDGTIDVRPDGVAGSQPGVSDDAHGRPSGAGKLLFIIHGHIETRDDDDQPDDGMVDAPEDPKSEGRGDADGLFKYHVPVATVYGNHIGWRELRNGQLTFRVPLGAQTWEQLNELQTRLNKEQEQFLKPLGHPAAQPKH